MKAIVWLLVIVFTVVIQSTILPIIAVMGHRPDLLLIVVISVGLLNGKEHGVGVGFFSGLLQDLASGNMFGLNALPKMLLGYIFGTAERQVFKEHILLPIFAVAFGTCLSSAFLCSMLILFGQQVDLAAFVGNRLLPLLIYNVVLAIPVHWLVYRIIQRTNAE